RDEDGGGRLAGFGGFGAIHVEAPDQGVDQPAPAPPRDPVRQGTRQRRQQARRRHPGQPGDRPHRAPSPASAPRSAAMGSEPSPPLPVTTPAIRPCGSSSASEALWSIEYWSSGAPSGGVTLANTIDSEPVNAARAGMSAVAARVSRWKA